jgi:DNA-binding NarL/FixJ family response regulator
MGGDTVRVVVADDSVLFREGLAGLLEARGLEVIAQVGDADQLIEAVGGLRPSLALVDIRMPPTHTNEGLLAAMELRARHPDVSVLVLSHHVESTHAAHLLADNPRGVGYLLKDRVTDVDEFIDVLRRVGAGGCVIDPEVVATLLNRMRANDPLSVLTPREREVLALMAEGRSNQAISDRLCLTAKTVETHVARIFTKLGLPPAPSDHRRVLAVITYLRSRSGLAAPPLGGAGIDPNNAADR